MATSKTVAALTRFVEFEQSVCRFFNHTGHRLRLETLFYAASRLGDGVFWYALMVTLPVIYGADAFYASGHMFVAGLVGVLIYKILKTRTVRERPYVRNTSLVQTVPPLDRYSFPSGHTLHAVSFTVVATHYYPELAWLLVPFATLVALSRLVLGLHYPTDVAAGALLGAGIARTLLHL
jgi:undecaprenyl-diphosphatase